MASDILKQVQESNSPAEALKALIGWAEWMEERFDVKPPSDWDSWGSVPTEDEATVSEPWAPDSKDQELLTQYKEELSGNEDADESKALRAKILLQEDKLKPPPELHDNSGTPVEATFDDDGNATIDLPPPTPEQIDARGQLLPQLGLQDQYGAKAGAEYEDSYLKGGPMVLYLADRDYVNGLPHGVKAAMVDDVLISSPREAHEMSRDVLKASTDDANDLDSISERIFSDAESGNLHNAP